IPKSSGDHQPDQPQGVAQTAFLGRTRVRPRANGFFLVPTLAAGHVPAPAPRVAAAPGGPLGRLPSATAPADGLTPHAAAGRPRPSHRGRPCRPARPGRYGPSRLPAAGRPAPTTPAAGRRGPPRGGAAARRAATRPAPPNPPSAAAGGRRPPPPLVRPAPAP